MKPFGFERNTERSRVREKLYVTLERDPSKKKKTRQERDPSIYGYFYSQVFGFSPATSSFCAHF